MKNANQLTPAETERLAILVEEISEVVTELMTVQKVVGKILRHGFIAKNTVAAGVVTYDNRARLEEELGHVRNITRQMIASGDIRGRAVSQAARKKEKSWGRYLHHQ